MRPPSLLRQGSLALLAVFTTLTVTLSAPAPAPAASPTAATHPDLVQLTAANWSTSINHGAWLIEFYSPYCAHCKAFLPLWMELTKNKADLATNYPDAPFQLAQVNCYAQRQLCVDEQVPHFPRLTVYRDGRQSQAEYQGDREYTELAKWIDDEAKMYRQIKGVPHVPHPLTTAPASVQQPLVGPPGEDAAPLSPVQDAASAAIAAAAATPSGQAVPLPQPPAPQSSALVVAAPPPVEPQSPPPPPPIDESLPNPRGQLLQYGITPGLTTIEELRQWLGVTADAQDYGMNYAQQKDRNTPITAENTNEGSHGTGSNEQSPGFGGARLTTAPSTETVDRKATISKGGTFVKFFAPWCPHCRAMAHAFEQLAPDLKNKLNILEVDCQANLQVCRSFQVSSYPTLRLYSPVNRLVSEYRGSRSFDKMRDWCHKAAEEEVVDLYEARDERHWDDDISRREEVRFLWLSDEPRDDNRNAWEQERKLVTGASKILFTSPFKVYRSSHPALLQRFESRLSYAGTKGYRSVLLAFHDHRSDRPVAAHHLSDTSDDAARTYIEKWLDWNRYPTLSTIGGESWVDVMNNAHGAPVVLALLSEEHHDGDQLPTGSGNSKRRAEIAALKRMAIAWREEGWQYRKKSDNGTEIKYTSNGGLLWGWMDADRWRKAVRKYYGTREDAFPALVLVDNQRLVYYPLPTNRPAKAVDLKILDPPPKVLTAAGQSIVSEWRSKLSYLGESSEVSTWLGLGGSASEETLATLPSDHKPTQIIDDLSLLPLIASIATGAHSNLARSSRSYLDRGVQSIEALVLFSARHWFLSILFVIALVVVLAVYVRSVMRSDARGAYVGLGYYKTGGTKAD